MATYRWLVVCAVVALAAHEARAQRGGGFCLTPIGNTRVEGDLHVVGRCTLTGTEVRGNVTLYTGGSLTARDARIRGDLEGSRADFVDLRTSRIDGSVDLDEFVGDSTTFEASEIHGSVELTANESQLRILNNDFRNDVVASGNFGGLEISGNLFDQDLRCDANTPPPTGVGNRVEGDAEGQCASLAQADPPPAPAPTPPPPPPPAPTPPPPQPTPAPAPPPTSSPPPAAPPGTELAIEDGGAGAMGWLTLLLLPLLAARRRRARR